MKFKERLLQGILVKRYKRFFIDIKYKNKIITAHCPNSGSMMGLLENGNKAWFSISDNPNRKLKYTLEIIEVEKRKVGINTMLSNKIVLEALKYKKINELVKFTKASSAVNEITIGNAATGDNASIKGTGETNIGIDLEASGTGTINLKSPISGDCEVLTSAGGANVAKPLTMINAGSPVNITLAAGAVTGQSKKFLNVGTGVASIKPTVMNFGDTVAMTRWSSCEMIWIDSSLASGVGAGWHLLGGADSGDAAITISG